jgi:beta-galactosidase
MQIVRFAVLLLPMLGCSIFGEDMLGVDVYPDRPVSRPLDCRKSTFESTAVRVAGGDVVQRAESFNHCSYGALNVDGENNLLWEFNVKPGQLDKVSLVLDEKSDFIRIRPESISFQVKNLGSSSVAFYGVVNELDWTPDSQDRFYSWHTGATEWVFPGETKTVRFGMDRLFPYGGCSPDREPVFPMSLKILLHQLEPDTDYKIALRGLTIHTRPSEEVAAEQAAVRVTQADNQQVIAYEVGITTNSEGWQHAYLEIRRDPEVFWRRDVTEQLKGQSAGTLHARMNLPPLLPKGAYELGLAVDGLRVAGSEAAVELGTERKPGFPSVALESHSGRPTIKINGSPFIWTGYASYEWQPGPLEDFGKAGVNLFLIPCNAGRHMHQISPPLMAEPGRLDFGPLEESILLSLSAQPDAKILLRISLALPPHLLQEFPESIARVRTPAGDLEWEETGTLVASYTSSEWKRQQAAVLRDLLAFIEKQPYADRVIGACLTAGATEEWFMYGINDKQYADYSPVNEAAFATWSKEKGFPYTRIPDPSQRVMDLQGFDVFPDNENSRAATAYAAFMGESAAESLLYFCRETKQATAGKLLTGTMYAYILQLAGEPRQHLANNLNMGDLVNAPEFDFFMGIPLWNYRHRIKTGYDSFVTAVSSANLHGKTFVNENDTFSWLHNGPWYKPYDRKDPLGAVTKVHQRVCGSDVIFGNQSEWFGLFASWHYDPEGGLMKAFEKINQIKIGSIDLDREPVEEIAFLIDDSSYNWTTPGTTLTEYQLPRFVYELARTGAPVGLYLLSDIDRLPEQIKLAVVPWAPAMSPETRKKLSVALRSGKRDFYLTGPIGLINTDPAVWAWDETSMREDFGLPICVINSDQPMTNDMQVTLSNGAEIKVSPQKIGWGFSGEKVPDGNPILTCPTLAWDGEGAFAQTPDGQRAVAGRKVVNGKSVIWSSVAIQAPRFLDELIEAAGIHRYVPRGFTVQAARGVVSVMASTGGTAEVDFGRAVVATDLFTGESRSGQKQKWNFEPGGTRLFKLEAE